MSNRIVHVRSADKRSDGFVRWEGWESGQRAIAKFFDPGMADAFVDLWNDSLEDLADALEEVLS